MSDDRRPQAFRLGSEPETKPKASRRPRVVTDVRFEPDDAVALPAAIPPVPPPKPRGFRWGALLISALAALVSLAAGLAVVTLIEELYARSALFGWLGAGLAVLAGLAAVAVIAREIWGLVRLGRIEELQADAARALNQNDDPSARRAIAGLSGLYGARPDMALGLKALSEHADDIIEPAVHIRLAAETLLAPLDAEAHRIVARAARRVTLLTTVTPAAVLDILFVAAQNLRMMRELATLYGGRPSLLATFRLARMVVSHLAVAGGLALSDSLVQHIVGKGLIGRLSARFGEGAVNGILTARIGLAAQDVCRPVPRDVSAKESLASLMREVLNFRGGPQEAADRQLPQD